MASALRRIALGALAFVGLLGAACAPAEASHGQVAMFEDNRVLDDPSGLLNKLRLLGADELRLFMQWRALAPHAQSHRRPRGFVASDPAAYPDSAWARYDTVIRQALADGIALNLDVAGGAPLWATRAGAPKGAPHPSWEPSVREFGAFVRAVGRRYSGDYDPVTHRIDPGNPDDLPAVSSWSLWNEPNFGPSLAPQGLPGRLYIEHSAATYRGLLDAGWSALRASGHVSDTILFGELAPRGYPAHGRRHHAPFGVFGEMKPLEFLRALYCVDGRLRPLRGADAAARSCPTGAAGSRRFRSRHPAMFAATGFAIHPYDRWYPPNVERPDDPDYASLADMARLERELDALQRAYGSRRQLPIWDTEYGYLTSPPKRPTRTTKYVSPATAAAYLNQAEYMSWRDPRLASFMQYLLRDPEAPTATNGYGGYSSGIETWDGQLKPGYHAWRLPLYLPATAGKPGSSLEVWGCVRPAFFALQDVPLDPESVEVQFAPTGSDAFTTVATVPITDPHGYFDTHLTFPGSGTVRLTWAYPADDLLLPAGYRVYSREVSIALH